MTRIIPTATVQAIHALSAEGKSSYLIATFLGLKEAQVKRVLYRKPVEIDEAHVVRMAQDNVSVLRLCRVFGVGKPQILDILTRHGIEPIRQTYATKAEKPKVRYPEEKSVTGEDRLWKVRPGKPNPMGMARFVWQHKLTDSDGCLKLDGRPIKFHDLMRKTNAALVRWGLPQMDANEDWLVIENKTVD